MKQAIERHAPGTVRDAIIQALSLTPEGLSVKEIEKRVYSIIGSTPTSSVRSYLRLNTPELFIRENRGIYRLQIELSYKNEAAFKSLSKPFIFKKAQLYHRDCFEWLKHQQDNSIHAVVTDPPYGLHEYSDEQQFKLRNGKGGVWRIPPSYDGHTRSPLPRFTTLTEGQKEYLKSYFYYWALALLPKLVPGANVIVSSNPLVSFIVSSALYDAGMERRGVIIRLVMTMRGGDRPKNAHDEFRNISVMPRSMWEPWLLFRKPIEGRVQDNLRKWRTGGFRRPSTDKPFGDVIQSSPTRKNEREICNHPSLKPQKFLRQLIRGVLPLGEGTILDPFAGSGSTLAATQYHNYSSIGIEKDIQYFKQAKIAIPLLLCYGRDKEVT